eukprot:gene7542-biopygen5064
MCSLPIGLCYCGSAAPWSTGSTAPRSTGGTAPRHGWCACQREFTIRCPEASGTQQAEAVRCAKRATRMQVRAQQETRGNKGKQRELKGKQTKKRETKEEGEG